MPQMGFYFDQSRCTGCYTCVVACKDWYDPEPDPGPGHVRRMRVQCIEQGRFPDLFVAYLAFACGHCENPPCAAACPEEAISKRQEDGIVVVDPEKCIGNSACPEKCLKACPWGAPQFGPQNNARMQKCELCIERLEQGQQAICVEACPMFALDAGPIARLREKYGDNRTAEGFKYLKRFGPAAVFKAKNK